MAQIKPGDVLERKHDGQRVKVLAIGCMENDEGGAKFGSAHVKVAYWSRFLGRSVEYIRPGDLRQITPTPADIETEQYHARINRL
jgi:hypothetical protein